MNYLGIDPGQRGGIALIDADGFAVEAIRFPGDLASVAEYIRSLHVDYTIRLAALEKVSSRPGQGVSSTFKFGANFGAYLGALAALGIPHTLVTPRSWQKEMLDAGTGDTKARSLNAARRLFPDVEMKYAADDGIADALHLARWARKQIMNGG